MKQRFYLALTAYGLLALLAAVTLDGRIRLATLILLAGVALKTWLVTLRRDEE
jgi:hypothetical protein